VGQAIKKEFCKKGNTSLARYLVRFSMPVLNKALYHIAKNGVRFDLDAFPFVVKEVQQLLETFRNKLLTRTPAALVNKHVKKGLSFTRADFIRDIFFSNEGFHLPIIRRIKSGASIDKHTRRQLLDISTLDNGVRRFILLYEEWIDTHTIFSRNIKTFNKYVQSDGRIHPKLNLSMAKTGRLATSKPNLMAIPKRSKLSSRVRSLLCASPGYTLLTTDQSQSELRIMAHVSNDPEMLKVFRTGGDIHLSTAKAISGIKWHHMSAEEKKQARQNSKSLNFGLLYGMQINGFLQYAKAEYGVSLSYKQAEEWINIFFSTYAQIKTYHSNTVNFCRRHGYIESLIGRRRRLPDINAKDTFIQGEAERQAINHPIQSLSSDIVLLVCNDIIDLALPYEEIRPVLFIHDELIFEIREDKVMEYAKIVKERMENPSLKKNFNVVLNVPLVAGIKVGKNLSSLKEIEIIL
jgi:DNA polymerase-1